MIKFTTEQGLMVMFNYYNSEIEKTCNKLELKHFAGIEITDEDLSKNNEKLYSLFMSRKNISDILDKIDDESNTF